MPVGATNSSLETGNLFYIFLDQKVAYHYLFIEIYYIAMRSMRNLLASMRNATLLQIFSMSMNATDNKFGLPKPDFQALPKKKAIWPVLVIIAIVVLLIAVKVGYNFYFKVEPGPPPATANNSSTTDQSTASCNASPATTPGTGCVNSHRAAQSSVRSAEGFEPKQGNKIKKSISATQKQLTAKQHKPLVKPGTYQELSAPQGIYHLVVVSHLDKRSAMKVVQQLMKNNLGVYLILPRVNKGEKYYRVTIGHSKTHYEASRKLEQFKSKYNNIFILEY